MATNFPANMLYYVLSTQTVGFAFGTSARGAAKGGTVFVLLSAARPDCKGPPVYRGIAATYGVFRQDRGLAASGSLTA